MTEEEHDMAALPPDSARAGVGLDDGPSAGTPRWVKVAALVAVVLVVLIAVMLAFGGGEHGPGRHTGSGDGGGHTPPAGLPEGHTPPPGVAEGHMPPAGGHAPPESRGGTP